MCQPDLRKRLCRKCETNFIQRDHHVLCPGCKNSCLDVGGLYRRTCPLCGAQVKRGEANYVAR